MFVRSEVSLPVGFAAAEARLTALAGDGWLNEASASAYDDGLGGIEGLARVGPFGDIPGVSKLVRVMTREIVRRGDNAVLTLRWQATGPGGRLFPALDADITLTAQGAQASLLTLDGAYRPPLAGLGAGLDRAMLNRVATRTATALLRQLASAIEGCPDEPR